MSMALNRVGFMSRLFPIDLVLSIAVYGVVAGLIMQEAAVATHKAKFTEALIASSIGRYDLVERYALTGAWSEEDEAPEAALAAEAQDDSGTRAHEAAIAKSGDRREAPVAADPAATRGDRQATRLETSIVDGNVVVAGRLGHLPPIQFGMRPAVADAGAWSVNWICGSREAPASWESPTVSVAVIAPRGVLTSHCRSGRVS